MDCWIITGHDVYGVGSWLEDASELHAAEVPLMEYAGGVQILIDGVNGSSSCGNRPFCVWFLLGSLAPTRRNCMPEFRVILKSGLLFPQSHPLPLFYSDEMWQILLMEGVRSEPKYAELAYFRSILGNTGTQKRKALLLPSFVCQFPSDGLLIQMWRKWQTIHMWKTVRETIYWTDFWLHLPHKHNKI